MKQSPSTSSTPTKQKGNEASNKQKSKPATPKQEGTSTNKPLNKSQLYINPLKESITVDDLKSLYPKAKFVKMQKRKIGPERKPIQYASLP